MNTENRIEIFIANVRLTFALKLDGNPVLISKDRNDVYIQPAVFNAARQRAAAILRKKKSAREKELRENLL